MTIIPIEALVVVSIFYVEDYGDADITTDIVERVISLKIQELLIRQKDHLVEALVRVPVRALVRVLEDNVRGKQYNIVQINRSKSHCQNRQC